MIFDYYFIIYKWELDFYLSVVEVYEIVVWIYLLELVIEYFCYDMLWKMGDFIGYIIKVDIFIEGVEWGNM